METCSILAHRGWWQDPSEKNSPQALERALEAGFGIETDFRDLDGRVVISHDPARLAYDLRDAEWLLRLAGELGGRGRIAMNIKADGLQAALTEALAAAELSEDRAYAFDMAVPDALGYLARELPTYTRVSEYETVPPFLDRAAGVWVDNFTGAFPQVARAAELMKSGKRVAIVSPELHRRDHAALWDEIAAARLHENPLFELCTDLPQLALDKFGTR